ncbi:LysR family transcriptional regulator [Deltaproteobacteria bacterium OttesenSCG-928-K17]|nr:LysR family transcriptional regulator [Deltaproteobacteria bacterium OttesenSCG-928-K17]
MIPEFSGDFIQWLRGFYYTAQTGSMTSAAELMNRNQSAITHQIKSLEDELGVKLFTGAKGKRSLTNEGRHLLAKANQIFGVVSEIVENIGKVSDELSGQITIASFYTLMQYYLPEKAARFGIRYPDVNIRITGSSQREAMFDRIYSREYDFGIMSVDSYPPEFESDALFSSDMVLISPVAGPWAVAHLPSLERLAQLPFISHPGNSSLEPYLQHQFARLGLALRAKHMVSHCGALKEYVVKGLGVAILDRFVCLPDDYKRLNVVSLKSFFPKRTFGILKRRDMYLSAHVDAFLKYLLANRDCPTAENADEAEDAPGCGGEAESGLPPEHS